MTIAPPSTSTATSTLLDFTDVAMTFPDGTVALSGIDLTVKRGEFVTVVGPSGCGKSTLLASVLRLLPVQAGTLDLEGDHGSVPLAGLAAADLPPLIAGSLQGDHVFDASLRDNVLVVRPAASDAELSEVAARAGLAAFVDSLPLGWATPAGADGAALSGGQRQRLLLARALLANPAILVLDEPTAHLDEATERAVLSDLLAGTRGMTVLMSTHRQLPYDELDAVLEVRNQILCPQAICASASL